MVLLTVRDARKSVAVPPLREGSEEKIMRIARAHIYRHRNCIDLDMHVVRILWMSATYFKLDVVWVNRFSPNILNPDRVVLQIKDLPNWTDVTEDMCHSNLKRRSESSENSSNRER